MLPIGTLAVFAIPYRHECADLVVLIQHSVGERLYSKKLFFLIALNANMPSPPPTPKRLFFSQRIPIDIPPSIEESSTYVYQTLKKQPPPPLD